MALTVDEIAQVYEIAGIPQNGDGFAAFALSSLWGPAGEAYDFSTIITALNAKITALSAAQCTRIRLYLTRWDDMGGTSQLMLSKSSDGAEGVVVNDPGEREAIRKTIFNLIGFFCPRGGFLTQFEHGSKVSR